MLQRYKKGRTYANKVTKMDDELYMSRCLALARKGVYHVAPNPMVGAVLVSADGCIVGEGWHRRYGGAHAEVNAYEDARERMRRWGWKEDFGSLTLYVSLEPCSHWGKTPPCATMIAANPVKRVVIGCLDPNPKVSGKGVQILREAGIEVTIGVMEQACREQNRRFLCLQEKHRPWVIIKWAETSDGYIDWKREGGKPLVISTPIIKQLVHEQRAANMAIMVGTNTVLLDNPKLTVSHWSGCNPIRVTVDRHHILPSDRHIFSPDAETIVYRECTEWRYIVQDLGERGIHSVLVEGGSTLINSILESGIWDEVHIEVAPFALPPLNGVMVEGVKAPQYEPTVAPKIVDNHQIYIERFGQVRKNT